MSTEPRHEAEYEHRQIEAARRVLVDVGQVLAAYQDSIVVVGGWVPDLLLPDAEEPHIGSIDVDLAIDASRLGEGRYAEMIKALTGTKRYEHSDELFRLHTMVSLEDGGAPVRVDVDFLKALGAKTRRNRPKLTKNFRPLDASGCEAAFRQPELVTVSGAMISGAQNTVRLQVASIPDFLVMKCYALGNRDKPKDAYDICYCLEHYPGGLEELAGHWADRSSAPAIQEAVQILREKFSSVDAYGPRQVVEFHQPHDREEGDRQAQGAYQVVRQFLALVEPAGR